MSYITWAELQARYSQIAKDYDNADTAQGFINGAEAEIDARLGVRYTVPFTPVPAIIKDLAIDMAYYRMYWKLDEKGILRDFIERRIGALASGSMTIVQSGSELSPDALAWSDRDGIRSSFGPDDATEYSTSADWQEDAQIERSYD